MTRPLTVGSLFSGIGGLDLGLERAGMQIKFQVEIDPFCQKVLAKHWPEVKRYGDIKTLTGTELEPVDLICGGFPCQPVSVAGKRRGTTDERWLWSEFARLLRVVRPRYVLIENVPGLLRLGGTEVLRDLAAIGYNAEWQTIPAAAFGAPHLRYRVFIVAYTNNNRKPDSSSKRAQEGDTPLSYSRSSSESLSKPQSINGSWSDSRESIFSLREGAPRRYFGNLGGTVWDTEPDLGRVATRTPHQVDRLRALGNAVVPQVAEWIGRRIMEKWKAESAT